MIAEDTAQNIGASKASISTDKEAALVNAYNAGTGNLGGGIDCPICRNKGNIMVVDEFGQRHIRECGCMEVRRGTWLLAQSGLDKVVSAYTWEAWESVDNWQRLYYEWARRYSDNPKGWALVSGRPGTGKTHLCTAICADQIKKGIPTRYLLWKEFSTEAKAVITDAEAYKKLVDPFKRVQVLYIDDFFKAKNGDAPTAGDCNLAFEIINARYADPQKVTIISSELPIERILDVDEATGSRIYERSRGNYIDLSRMKNWRLIK